MKKVLIFFFLSVFSINWVFAGPKGWTALRIDCTNDNNMAALKWTKRNVDSDGCTYVQIDLAKEAKRNMNWSLRSRVDRHFR